MQITRIGSQRRRRTTRRGAAMVEGAVVLSVLTIFLGLMMFIHGQYRQKIAVTAKARADTWLNALNGCGGGGAASGGGDDLPSLPDGTDKVVNGGPLSGFSGLMTLKTTKTQGSSMGTTNVGLYTGTASSTSHLFCNEVGYGLGDTIGQMFDFIANFWRSGL